MNKPLKDTLSVKRSIKHFDFSEPYWEGTKQKKLVLQRCKATGKFQHFPRPVSIFTGRRRDIEWKEVSGKGTVYSYTITERGSRTNETIDALKALWTQDTPSYSGKHFRFDNIKALPQPVQKPRPPILVGGMTKGALQRTARRGDGWIAMGKSPDDIKAPFDTLRELTIKAGRKPEDLQINMLPLAAPSLDQVVGDLPRYQDLGVQHVYLSFRAWTADFSQLMELMARFAREVGLKA